MAEELEYGAENVTSGAISDFQQATRTAHAMVTKYGLSEKLGIMYVDEKLKNSAETQQWVDQEVRALLNDSYARAKNILASHRDQLHLLAEGLVEFETLSGRFVGFYFGFFFRFFSGFFSWGLSELIAHFYPCLPSAFSLLPSACLLQMSSVSRSACLEKLGLLSIFHFFLERSV